MSSKSERLTAAGEKLELLKKECAEMEEHFLSDVCDNCRWCYTLSQEELDEECKKCTFESGLQDIMKRVRTVAFGEVMKIVAEELHPEKKGATP